ncbi:BRO-N domain-containing protein [Paraclostridium sordellii]|uniref:BRO-N domain-containing protein n=1 Tax=Paraclostridium sordellii TaxID=1505 RepID=UPI0005E582D4|nr:BRO family protein [Paeniclostridium sordellii]CEO07587.1 prophage antirepressor [[Clostridium] sordellii] [Paeniclostridium sordellii]
MDSFEILDSRKILGKEITTFGTLENPLFLAKDVAEWIEHNQVARMIELVDGNEKLKCLVSTSGQAREMWFLTEDGLYEVLMQSRKPIAKKLKKEIKKILKQIRLTGGYIPISTEDDEKVILEKAVKILNKTLESKEILLKQKEEELEVLRLRNYIKTIVIAEQREELEKSKFTVKVDLEVNKSR